jgi:hypothetical protein
MVVRPAIYALMKARLAALSALLAVRVFLLLGGDILGEAGRTFEQRALVPPGDEKTCSVPVFAGGSGAHAQR